MRSAVLCTLVFVGIFAAHVGYKAWEEKRVAARWVAVEVASRPSAWTRYVERQDYCLGYSYALAAGFTTFALLRSIQRRRRARRGVLGGVTLMGTLYAAGCFLIGCCGSPMAGVYLSLFGSLSLVKPATAGLTTIAVVASCAVLLRRSRRESCAPACACQAADGAVAPGPAEIAD